MTNTLYRVYDKNNNYQASYDSHFPQAKEWAAQCAARVNGRVEIVDLSKESEENLSSEK
jgi:hypothetical protein